MKKVLLTSAFIIAALTLVSCGGSTETQETNGAVTPGKKAETIMTPEQKELSQKMITAAKDLRTSQVIGNPAFANYDKLTVKYGLEGKLDKNTEFNGKDGFVNLTGLSPDTVYHYEIYSGTKKISSGTAKTQPKK